MDSIPSLASSHQRPWLRRLILIGTPLLTGILLLFHPHPDPAEMGLADQSGSYILLGLSFIFTFHASVLGSIGMLLFFLASWMIDSAGSLDAASVKHKNLTSS